MANNLDPSIEEMWSKRQQIVHHKQPIFQAIANMEEKETLKKGDTVHRTYRSRFSVNDMGAEGSFTRQDVTDTDESLSIDKEKEVSFYVKSLDAIQTKYHTLSKTGNKYAEDAGKDLYNNIDADFLAEMASSADGNAGTTAAGVTSGVTVTTANVVSTVTTAYQNILTQTNDMNPSGLFAAISPQFYNTLIQVVGARETQMGDGTTRNGRVGSYFGFDLYLTNATSHTSVLALATQPTANDTVVYNGVTFTFVATPAVAGDVDLGGDVDASRANLAAAINGGAGAGTTYIEVSATDRALLNGVTAVNDDTNNVLVITANGKSVVAVSETLTDGTDEFTAAAQVQNNVFGIKGATDMVIQKAPNCLIKDRDGYVGKDFVSWTAYGVKTFDEGDAMLYTVPVRTDGF